MNIRMAFFKMHACRLLKNAMFPFLLLVFPMTTFSQQQIISASWTQVNSSIPGDLFVPRELFKINDTTLYLGCRYYLLRVTKDSLKVEFKDEEENVIRSVVSFDNTLYVSNKNNSVLQKINDTTWVNILQDEPTKGNYNWEMTVYNKQLIYSSWPRWLEYYNLKTKKWEASSMLDEQGAGYISDFKKIKKYLYVSLYGGGVYRKDRTGYAWLNCNTGLPGNLNVRSIAAVKKTLFAATENGIYYTRLSSLKWRSCNRFVCKPVSTPVVQTKYVDLMYHNRILYATGTDGELMVSKDQGNSWIQVNINGATGYVLYSIEAMGQDLYLSADGQGKKPSGVFTIPIHTIESAIR